MDEICIVTYNNSLNLVILSPPFVSGTASNFFLHEVANHLSICLYLVFHCDLCKLILRAWVLMLIDVYIRWHEICVISIYIRFLFSLYAS